MNTKYEKMKKAMLSLHINKDWEEVPDEDLFEDGEITLDKTVEKIKYHLFNKGDWKLIRRRK